MRRMFGFIGIIVGTQFIVSSAIAGTTYVSGIISANTVWDPTGSPYIVTGNVLVNVAVTLDIEPGVEVRIDEDKYIMIEGTLNAIGTEADSIIITKNGTERWQRLRFKPASAGSLMYCRIEYANNSAIYDDAASSLYIGYNTISNNSTGSAYGGGGIYSSGSPTITGNTISNNSANYGGGGIRSDYGSPTITGNTISNNSADNGGGIYSDGSATITGNTITDNSARGGGGIYSDGSPTITGNTITDNSAGLSGGGICSYGSPTITGNTISNNSADLSGGGIYSPGSATITGNTISNNSADDGGGIYSDGSATIKYNTITDTTESAIYINSDSALIDSNNIYATGYAVWNNDTFDINARYNYWGTTDSATIANEKIWDFYDDFEKGIVYYEPFLADTFGIEEKEKLRVESLELRVYPNPSFGNALIKYGVPEKAVISLGLYDISGRLVKTLYSGIQEKGYHTINVGTRHGMSLPAGIYFIRFEAGNYKATRKLTILR